MGRDKPSVIIRFFIPLAAFLLLLLPDRVCAANAAEELHKYLRSRGAFTEADLSQVDRGELVSKLLPVHEKHEIAFCGVISLNSSPTRGFDIFKERLTRLDKRSLMASGSFSDVPAAGDLDSLTLEKVDIESLKTCRLGNCDVNLSAEMIERFQNAVDWGGPNYSEQATDLYRQLLLEYVTDYLSRSHAGLIEYNNYRNPLSLGRENDLDRKSVV